MYLICRETVDPRARLHARLIFYGREDPATGSAAGCAAAWMVAHGVAASDERVLIEQGLEAHRPSRLFATATREGDRITAARVAGQVVEVMRAEVVV
jgi:trans-2,3-dihydro-3-hydroxyanthranilate isomerase